MERLGLHKIQAEEVLNLKKSNPCPIVHDQEYCGGDNAADLIIMGDKLIPHLIKNPLPNNLLSGNPTKKIASISYLTKIITWKALFWARLNQALLEAKGYNNIWATQKTEEAIKLTYLGLKAYKLETSSICAKEIYKPWHASRLSTTLRGNFTQDPKQCPNDNQSIKEELEEAKLFALCKTNFEIIVTKESLRVPNYSFLKLINPIESWEVYQEQ